MDFIWHLRDNSELVFQIIDYNNCTDTRTHKYTSSTWIGTIAPHSSTLLFIYYHHDSWFMMTFNSPINWFFFSLFNRFCDFSFSDENTQKLVRTKKKEKQQLHQHFVSDKITFEECSKNQKEKMIKFYVRRWIIIALKIKKKPCFIRMEIAFNSLFTHFLFRPIK